MTNGQPFSIYTLTITFALLYSLVLNVQSAKENLETQSDNKVVSNIQKREAETESQDSAVHFNEYHDEPVKRSTNEEETLDLDDLNLPDKRGRSGNRYGFFGSLGKRNDLEDVDKRRMRNMFFGSLGKRDDAVDDDSDMEKRRQAFFAALGKREGEMDDEELLDELEKRGRRNRYFYGALGKRDSMDEGEDDIDKRRMRFFGSLGKRDPEDEMDKRGRNFGFFGSLGKRQGTSTEGDDTDFEDINELDKRRYQRGFFGSLGKRDDEDLEKRRRMKGYAFASLGKRFDELEDEDSDDIEKRRMRMRPSFYGSLGKRRYRTRNLFFGQLGKRSVSSETSDNVMYDNDQTEEHSRRKRSLSTFRLSRAFRGNPYGRKRRYNRRIAIGTRLIRRTPSFRIFPTLGKRSSDTSKYIIGKVPIVRNVLLHYAIDRRF